jgi:hypothetical protein
MILDAEAKLDLSKARRKEVHSLKRNQGEENGN